MRTRQMTPFVVVLDACVLYPAQVRSLFMYLAGADLLQPHWTDQIHEEWIRNLLNDHPNITREKAERIRELMDAHVPDCLIVGHEAMIPMLDLPDANDRHVLAAAIHGGATAIVWATQTLESALRRCRATCSRQPTLPMNTAWAFVCRIRSALRSPSWPAISGCVRL